MKKIALLLILLQLLQESCCNEDFIIPESLNNDFFAEALDITSLMNTCSADEAFTTVDSTPDLSAGECWFNNGPLFNRWFKFTAPATSVISIEVYVGDTYGTQRKTYAVLWDTDGVTEIGCATFDLDDGDLYIYNGNLTAGNVYFLSVDVADAASVGTFTLCLSDAD